MKLWNKIEEFLVGALASAALLVACMQFATRYFAPSLLPDWGDEVVIYLVIWAVWLRVGTLATFDKHVRADLVLRLLPKATARLADLFGIFIGFLFCALMAWAGWGVVQLALTLDERSASSLNFPQWLYYSGFVLGMALMSLRYLLRFCSIIKSRGSD